MQERDEIQLVEGARLEQLKDISAEVVYRHVDFLNRELPGPIDLYQRWERQQWSATAVDFVEDRGQWQTAPLYITQQLRATFSGFFYGEQAVTDTLAPLLMGAPDEEQRLFLATQVVDEARHSYFFSRFYNDVLGVSGGLRGALSSLDVGGEPDGGYNTIFHPRLGELAAITEAVRRDPSDYGAWVEAVAVYHLMVEGLLALTGQRRALRLLRSVDLLPGFRAGFTAVTRDESRHVSYGVWALRQAVRNGAESHVTDAVDRTLGACVRIYANPAIDLPDPQALPPPARIDPMDTWTFAVDSVCKRLRTAGVRPDYVAAVEERAWSLVWDLVTEYEQRRAGEHPVRRWQRGEIEATPA